MAYTRITNVSQATRAPIGKVDIPICLECGQPMQEYTRTATTVGFMHGCHNRVKYENIHVGVFK